MRVTYVSVPHVLPISNRRRIVLNGSGWHDDDIT